MFDRMSKRPTVSDVAALAGVHRATAARALSPAGRSLLRAATISRVESAARELNYRPNQLATALRTHKSATIGVLLPDLTNPLFPPVVRGIEDVLGRNGYTALLANTDNDAARERSLFETLRTRRVDGFLIATARRQDAMLDVAAAEGVPVVLVNRCNDDSAFSLVTSQDTDGIGQAVRHLVGLGHQRIAYVGGPRDVSTADARVRAFRRYTRQAGMGADEAPVVRSANFTEPDGIAGAGALLDDHPDVTAIMAGNDLIALGVLRTCKSRGLHCPRDVSVVGFNDMRFADAFEPPLTTVRVPQYDLGVRAAELLLETLTTPRTGVRVVRLPVSLVIRGSTAEVRRRRR
jgi:LacI family transcriptional regulator